MEMVKSQASIKMMPKSRLLTTSNSLVALIAGTLVIGVSEFNRIGSQARKQDIVYKVNSAPVIEIKYNPAVNFNSYGNCEKTRLSDEFWEAYDNRVRNLNPDIYKKDPKTIKLPDVDRDDKVSNRC